MGRPTHGALGALVVTLTFGIASVSEASVAAGTDHSVALKGDGTVLAWGSNQNGQLGDGTTTGRLRPTPVSGLTNVIAVSAGNKFSVALRNDGTVWTWGLNSNGQLGDGTTTQRLTPVQVGGLAQVTAVSAGDAHVLALDAAGVVRAWGANASGQIGDGTTTTRLTPVQVSNLTQVVKVAAGGSHSLVAKADGSVSAWGLNSSGQVGDGSTTTRKSPVLVASLSGVTNVEAGGAHSLALLAAGTLRSWGLNANGQLGDGTTTLRKTPVTVSGISGVVAISGGASHSLALLSSGAARAWGLNTNGRLGDGTTTQRLTPVGVQYLSVGTGVSGIDIAAGGSHSLARAADQNLWAWGLNTSGQVGEGTTTERRSPVQITGSTPMPQIQPLGGVYSPPYSEFCSDSAVQVQMVSPTGINVLVRFTLDGSDPTTTDPVFDYNPWLCVNETTTVKARAWSAVLPPSDVAVASYTLEAAPLAFTPPPATYTAPTAVTISSDTPLVQVFYTTDGTEPTTASTEYFDPIPIATTTMINARAFRAGWSSSPITSGLYAMNFGQLAAPTLAPPPGTFSTPTDVTLSAQAGATIRFTTDGTDPTPTSSAYTAPIRLTSTTVLKAQAFRTDYSPSTVTTGTYTIDADTEAPTITASVTPAPNAAGWNKTDVLVTFTCNDAGSGIANCPSPVPVTTEGAGQMISGTATDEAGNTATTSITVNVDRTQPIISSTVAPPANAAGWNNTGVTVSFVCTDGLSGISTCAGPSTLTTEGSAHTVLGQGTDIAGNAAFALASVSIDMTPPTVAITSPPSGIVRRLSLVELSGTAADDNRLASIEVAGQSLPPTSPWSASIALVPGTQTLVARAIDVAGNATPASLEVTFAQPPVIQITAPTDLQVFGTTPITVTGTLDRAASVVVGVEKVPAQVSGNTWTAEFVPLREGGNILTAVATDAQGNVGTDSLTVVLDTVAPRVLIDSPANGSVTTDDRISVSGRVNDIVMGTVNSGQATVTVNGIPAQVANRTFLVTDVPLAPGLNTVTAVAVDAVGNQDQQQVGVQRATVPGPRIVVFSGGGQQAPIGQPLPQPLVVQITDNGAPLADRQVIFRVFENNGTVSDGTLTGTGLTKTTDAEGKTSISYTLGTRAGVGNNRVEATSPGVVGSAVFAASATLGPPTKINVDSGSLQRGIPGQPLPRPFVAVVTDEGHNRLPGVPVTFNVERGGGDFSGQTAITVNTDPDGRAVAVLTLGPSPGVEANFVSATAPNLSGQSAAFSATALEPGDPANTRIAGTVLDNQNEPIPGVTLKIRNTVVTAQTDAQGQFLLTGVPAGDVHLEVDGSSAQKPGRYPDLEFEIVTVPGALNSVGMPIYLLPLDLQDAIFVDETQGGTLALPEYPGFSLAVEPNSATFPDGTRRGTISVTVVHSDKVPMLPNFGQQPRFIVTIQPPGVRFEPPARITHPNVDGLQPGEVTELYSFDHDMGTFVATGTARVTADGTQIVSDPGTGIIKGGWHSGGNPTTTGTVAHCPQCTYFSGGECVTDPRQYGPACCPPGEFVVKYAAFIRPPYIPEPEAHPGGFCIIPPSMDELQYRRLWFKGDGRPELPYFEASSRGAQTVTIVPEECREPSGARDYRDFKSETREYADDGIGIEDGIPSDCSAFHSAGASTGSLAWNPSRLSRHEGGARLIGSIINGTLTPGAPITWEMNISIDNIDPGRPRYTISGCHAAYPNHEIWINGVLTYLWQPEESELQRAKLLLGCMIDVSCSGAVGEYCVSR